MQPGGDDLSELKISVFAASGSLKTLPFDGKRLFFYKCQFENQIYNLQNYSAGMKKNNMAKREGPNLEETQLYDIITRIEVRVLQRIQKLKTNPKTYICEHYSISSPECESYDKNINYYDKFWKRFLMNEIGKQNLTEYREQADTFSKRLDKVKTLFQQWEKYSEPVRRVKRRPSRIEEGEREICPHCQRAYRDEETLMIHIKVKHGETKASIQNQLDIFESDNLL